ncbi:MAG TPA: flagellar biosynthesis protein FlhB [Firmicutes bacterium]|nr:flagellar biosynthesis protein FlhB [Bacillota bacterium]
MENHYDFPKFRMDLQLFAEEKTERATPHKREEVRKKGQVARSGEIGTALLILVGFYAVKIALGSGLERLYALVNQFLANAANWNGNADMAYGFFLVALKEVAIMLLPIFGAFLLVGFAAQAFQVGFMFNLSLIQPQLHRINPFEGLKRLFSKRAIVELLKSVLKIVIVGWMAYTQVRKHLPWLTNLAAVDISNSFLLIGNSVFSLVQGIGLTLLVLAVADYYYQRWEFEQNIRMTKHEVKEEFKQTEGDPLIRSRIRQRQRELAARRMMQAVPTADVVITNPTHIAVALLYQADKMAAPEVVAKGAGIVAERIRELANMHGVPRVENPPLARALYRSVDIGQQIPAELYAAVAEVLAFVYRLRNRAL